MNFPGTSNVDQMNEEVSISDETLVGRARDGDRRAFETLVRRYEGRLFNYLRRVAGNAADAEDLFQETFVRVHTHLGRFRPGAPFKPWLYRIATNLCRDLLRSRRRHLMVSLNGGDRSEPGTNPVIERVANPGPGPDALAAERELAAALEDAVAQLPLKQRTVFLMARFEQMSYEEIAGTLRIPVGTVKSRMNKAVTFLLGRLKEHGM
jgi:RNA polymerase sigma-70 factor (ECF subfamily)